MTHFDELEQAVGRYMPNLPADVRKVQLWLDRWAQAEGQRMHAQGHVLSQQLHQAIEDFQRRVLRHSFPSGKITPGDETARKLGQPPPPPVQHPPTPPIGTLPVSPAPGTPLRLPPRTGFQPLSVDDYAAAAKELGCETLIIQALAQQEGRGKGFDSHNRPVIMWEPVRFASQSHHYAQYRRNYPTLTHKKPPPHVYGINSQQYPWLMHAYLINPRAALLAPSWGQFQILVQIFSKPGTTLSKHLWRICVVLSSNNFQLLFTSLEVSTCSLY